MTAMTLTERPALSRLRAFALPGLLLLLATIGIFFLGRDTDWKLTGQQFLRLSLLQVAALLGLSLVNYAFRALRWHVMTCKVAPSIGFSRTLVHYIGGLAMAVTPGRVGELVRIRWIMREAGGTFERYAPLALSDRSSDLAAMALLLALAIGFGGPAAGVGLLPSVLVAAAGVIAALILTRPELLRLTAEGLWRLTHRGARLFARVRAASRTLAVFARPEVLALTTLLGVIGWAAEGVAFHLLLEWLGADITLARSVAIFTFATLAGGATGAPGGIGAAEAAMIGLLTLEGVPMETALPATVIIRVTTLWFALVIGLCVFPFAERLKK